jgi:2,5-dioxopentanoate dehydrogenase
MQITGELLIGSSTVHGTQGVLHAINPATRETLQPPFGGATAADVAAACTLAGKAFDPFRALEPETRAQFLEAIAQGIVDLGGTLVERVMAESGLPRPRIEGERARTAGQLRLFAALVREGRYLNVTIDEAMPDRKPLPRADLRSRKIPLGPVAVFGASNFPLAFSVAGGDTASAFAAGCPVVAKAHPSHLGTSELVGRVIQSAAKSLNLPEGTFSLLAGEGNAVGEAMVSHPAIAAVGFTGSRRGGLALVALAAKRPVLIPVFAEMSSINPVFLLPAALAQRAETIAQGFADSMTLGTGQFCTKPGIVVAIEGPDFARFQSAAEAAVAAKSATVMLNPGIHSAYLSGTTTRADDDDVTTLAQGQPQASDGCAAQAILFAAAAHHFTANPALLEEIFGPTSILITCRDAAEMQAVAEHFDGQLTATLQMAVDDEADIALAKSLLPTLERKAGRILVNGFPTGVEVSHAMVHGGPSPATSDSRATSVGAMAIERFLRPVCYQDLPAALLPESLRNENPLHAPRLINGALQLP